MEGKEQQIEVEILSIVTHALIGNPEVKPDAVQLIVDQCSALVATERTKYYRCIAVINQLDPFAVDTFGL